MKHKSFQEAGSFRDPAGNIFIFDNRVLRSVNKIARVDYEKLRDTGVLSKAIQQGYLINFKELKKSDWPLILWMLST